MTTDGLICWSCGRPTGYVNTVGRSESCPHCRADLRTCRGCRHFDPSRRGQCRESIDRVVVDKEKANFCDFFQIRNVIKGPGGVQGVKTETKDDRKARFDALFED